MDVTFDRIKALVKGADMVFITAGAGRRAPAPVRPRSWRGSRA